MDNKHQMNFVEAIDLIAKHKGISKDEVIAFLEEVFIKAFNKEENWDWKNPIDEAEVKVYLDSDKGTIRVEKYLTVVEELNPITKLREIEITDPRVVAQKKKIGDLFIEEIDLSKLPITKIQHIKQLLIQKTREAEKSKIYEAFVGNEGKLVYAKVTKLEENHAILDKEGTSIFLPKAEMNPNDSLRVGQLIQVYVVEVNDKARDAQVIASRANAQFVEKLLEQENTDVASKSILIKSIAREAGVKTKIVVSGNVPGFDAIGGIIGPRGSKIKVLIEELGGERVDVINWVDNEVQLIGDALAPATILGVKVSEDFEGRRNAVIVVADDQFLATLGKKGVNVKLVSKLAGMKIDVKREKEAQELGITWTEYKRTERGPRGGGFGGGSRFEGDRPRAHRFDDLKTSVEEISDATSDDGFNSLEFSSDDYASMEVNTQHTKEVTMEEPLTSEFSFEKDDNKEK